MKHNTSRIHSRPPHSAQNGSNACPHNFTAGELTNDTAICGSQRNCQQQSLRELRGLKWSACYSTTSQSAVGLYSRIAAATLLVSSPRSCWYTSPSWLMMNVMIPDSPYLTGKAMIANPPINF